MEQDKQKGRGTQKEEHTGIGPLSPRSAEIRKFNNSIDSFYAKYGRSFPWRETYDPYEILVSEVMLQQTQVGRAAGYYNSFLSAYPTAADLAASDLRDLLSLWQGLGYNRRAKYLRETARMIRDRFSGSVPQETEDLLSLPGIGPATAAAVRVYAFGKPDVFLETNIRRVFIYFFYPEGESVRDGDLLPLIEAAVDRADPRRWYNAVTDYGAMLGKNFPNPNRRSAHYSRQPAFVNSNRQLRGRLLKLLSERERIHPGRLEKAVGFEKKRVERCLRDLEKEGFICKEGQTFRIRS